MLRKETMYRQNYPDAPGLHERRGSSPFLDRKQTLMLRVRQNLCGLTFGLLILALTTWLIGWNEGRAVTFTKKLDDGLNLVVPVGNSQIKNEHEGRLIHTTGTVEVGDFYEDKTHGVRIRAARVKRLVEMYQWHEMDDRFRGFHDMGPMHHPDYDGYGDPEMTYLKEWSSDLVRSDSFQEEDAHKNPESFPFTSEDFTSNSVSIGHYHISRDLLDKMSEWIPYKPTSAPSGSNIVVESGYFYHSKGGAKKPKIGDIRVSYTYAGLSGQTTISLVGQQYQGSIIGYHQEGGDALHVLHHGGHSAQTMIEKEIAISHILTWCLRITEWLLVFLGFTCFMGIVQAIVDMIPIVRDMIVAGGTALKLSVVTSYMLLVMAYHWIWIRPFFGGLLLVGAGLPFLVTSRRTRRHRAL